MVANFTSTAATITKLTLGLLLALSKLTGGQLSELCVCSSFNVINTLSIVLIKTQMSLVERAKKKKKNVSDLCL